MMLGRDRQWVYDHADELGAFRYGDGPRARLGFDASTVEQRKRRRRRHPEPARQDPRIRGRTSNAALIPYEGSGREPRIRHDGSPCVGSLKSEIVADGTRAFHLRFTATGRREHETLHERRGCGCGCGGGWTERTAAIELENVLARVQAGVCRKRRAVAPSVDSTEVPTFHEYASSWLESKISGVLGDRPIDENTRNDYRWRLARHLLPFFGEYQLDEIDARLCVAFKAHKLREAAELRAALAAGADLRDRNGRGSGRSGPRRSAS